MALKKYVNISGKPLALTGGRILPPFGEVDLQDDSYDLKFVDRGALFLQPSKPTKTQKVSKLKEEDDE